MSINNILIFFIFSSWETYTRHILNNVYHFLQPLWKLLSDMVGYDQYIIWHNFWFEKSWNLGNNFLCCCCFCCFCFCCCCCCCYMFILSNSCSIVKSQGIFWENIWKFNKQHWSPPHPPPDCMWCPYSKPTYHLCSVHFSLLNSLCQQWTSPTCMFCVSVYDISDIIKFQSIWSCDWFGQRLFSKF